MALGYPALRLVLGLIVLAFTSLGVQPELSARHLAIGPVSALGLAPPASAHAAPLTLSFEPNRGQTSSAVRFMAHIGNSTVYLLPDGLVVAGGSRSSQPAARSFSSDSLVQVKSTHSRSLLVRFMHANRHPTFVGLDPLPGRVNYLIGSDSRGWHTDLPTYATVEEKQAYPGVDVLYSGAGGRLEYRFVLHTGANSSDIRLTLGGRAGVQVRRDGTVAVGGIATLGRPLTYQTVNGVQRRVPSRYVLTGRRQLGFLLGPHDRTGSLVIDPLVYSTYLGGSEAELAASIAIGQNGNAYITGQTNSSDLPVCPTKPAGQSDTCSALNTTTTLQTLNNDATDQMTAFISELDAAGDQLIYSTYLGGSARAWGQSIAVDGLGDAYVTGATDSGDFPTCPTEHTSQTDACSAANTTSTLQPTFTGSTPLGAPIAFVVKLNPAGDQLIYSTYLGGAEAQGSGIAIDGSGDAFVTGTDNWNNFPTCPTQQAGQTDACSPANTTTTLQTVNRSYPHGSGFAAVFVAELNPTGSQLIYSTVLGGSGGDFGSSIAIDPSGDAYITGTSDSTDFPTCPTMHALQTDSCSSANTTATLQTANHNAINPKTAFVAELNPTGDKLVYSTYLGGTGIDQGYHVAVDGAGNAFVVGSAGSSDFPTCPTMQAAQIDACSAANLTTTLQLSQAGGGDAFVSELNPTGDKLVYSTYLGGGGDDAAYGIALDGLDDAYLIGQTMSSDFPTCPTTQSGQTDSCSTSTGSTLQTANAGLAHNATTAFFSELSPQGNRLTNSTYLGGSGGDYGYGIALDALDDAFLTGYTSSTDFPTCPTPQTGQSDACSSANVTTTLQGSPGGSSDGFVAEFSSAASTAVHLSRFQVMRRGSLLAIRWHMASSVGVAGFVLYAGSHRLTSHLIPVHPSRDYHLTVRWAVHGPVSLHLFLTDGQELVFQA
jgi:hypothetical protein